MNTSLAYIVIIFVNRYLSFGKCCFTPLNNIIRFISKDILSEIDRTSDELWSNSIQSNPDVDITTSEMIRKEGYPSEAHVILTDDGYLLTVHRIPGSADSPTVFLQHGLLGSSFDWVTAGKYKSLAFILADLGYDVWLGNARGNTYSRSHIKYSTSDLRFWNFSWHEMAIYDLPAEIAFIKKIKNDNLIYVGHSMGTTMFYVMAIDKPEIASNIKVMFSLAPIAFMTHLKSPVRLLVPFINEVEFIIRFFGEGEFLPQNIVLKFLAKYGCDINVAEEKICANTMFAICGFDKTQFNYTLMPMILSHTPAGASTKSIIHYGQEIKSGRFQRYDYGTKGNIKMYNSTSPPDYDLSKVKVPVGLFWSQNDWLASPIDVQRLFSLLPNTIINFKVDYTMFNHIDFIWAVDAPKLVYNELLKVMNTYR